MELGSCWYFFCPLPGEPEGQSVICGECVLNGNNQTTGSSRRPAADFSGRKTSTVRVERGHWTNAELSLRQPQTDVDPGFTTLSLSFILSRAERKRIFKTTSPPIRMFGCGLTSSDILFLSILYLEKHNCPPRQILI